MEIWDILDGNGVKTGRTILRSSTLQKGEYHLVVHIWITEKDGNFLIQKRPESLEWMPGIWGTTGGSAILGEDSLAAAVRETKEELGLAIAPGKFRLYKRLRRENDFTDVWFVEGRRSDFHPIVLSNEATDTKWVSAQEVFTMISRGEFVKYDYADTFLGSLHSKHLNKL